MESRQGRGRIQYQASPSPYLPSVSQVPAALVFGPAQWRLPADEVPVDEVPLDAVPLSSACQHSGSQEALDHSYIERAFVGRGFQGRKGVDSKSGSRERVVVQRPWGEWGGEGVGGGRMRSPYVVD